MRSFIGDQTMKFLLPKAEGKNCEFKRDITPSAGIIKTCAAFANTSGGSIFIGVGDDGEIVGIGDDDLNHLLDGFCNTIAQSISPFILPNLVVRNVEGKNILEIQIGQGNAKPYFIKSEGSTQGVYVRSGRSILRPAEDDLKELLLLQAFEKPYDARIPSHDATIKDLDQTLLKKVYSGYSEKDLEREGVLAKDLSDNYYPTLAALMVYGSEPQRFVMESEIIVTKFKGITGRDIVTSHDLSGNIGKMTKDAISLINEYTSSKYRLTNQVHFGPEDCFPEIVLREIILNALIHRKYNIAGPVKIAIFDDRLEIFSPGELPPSIHVESLGDGTSQIRNIHITKFARKLRLMEKLGSGILEANRAMAVANLQQPKFLEQAKSFKVILFRKKVFSAQLTPAETAEEILKKKNEINKRDLVLAGVLDRTASFTLSELVRRGILERIGKGKSTKYIKK
jgi:ATP-dependent DNA helicase RecG